MQRTLELGEPFEDEFKLAIATCPGAEFAFLSLHPPIPDATNVAGVVSFSSQSVEIHEWKFIFVWSWSKAQ